MNPCGVTGPPPVRTGRTSWTRCQPQPGYANPRNEIWLDVTTDDEGDGEAPPQRRVAVPAAYRAHSVVVHARQTDWRPALAGKAGARLACIDVPF